MRLKKSMLVVRCRPEGDVLVPTFHFLLEDLNSSSVTAAGSSGWTRRHVVKMALPYWLSVMDVDRPWIDSAFEKSVSD